MPNMSTPGSPEVAGSVLNSTEQTFAEHGPRRALVGDPGDEPLVGRIIHRTLPGEDPKVVPIRRVRPRSDNHRRAASTQ